MLVICHFFGPNFISFLSVRVTCQKVIVDIANSFKVHATYVVKNGVKNAVK